MNKSGLSIVSDAVVEVVGTDVLVHLSGASEVIRLSDATAEVFLAIRAGQEVDPSDSGVKELVAAGIVRSRGLTRRGLVKAGAVGLGAGIAVMAMPSVAVASSNSESPIRLVQEPTFARQFNAETQTTTLVDQGAVVLVSAVVTLDGGAPQNATGFGYFGISPGGVVAFRFNSLPTGTITRLEVRFTWEGVPFWAVYPPE